MKAPELQVSKWFNTEKDLSLSNLQGKVVVIEAFQMLCPGCVMHGIPLAQAVQRTFPSDQVEVIGLHTVFEHHDAMQPVSLAAFLHEYQITFPVGVDAAGTDAIPMTMQAYQMRGTPSLMVIDKAGNLRNHHFGEVSQLRLGAEIATLLAEDGVANFSSVNALSDHQRCDADGCQI